MNDSEKKDGDTRKKIALYYPYFMGGGAEAVGLWMLEALKEKYDLTLFTITNVDFEKLNSMYGTKLSKEEVKVKCLLPKVEKAISNWLIANNKDCRMLLLHLLIRDFKANQEDYDLVVSGYNAIDMGRRGIQYIHWVKVIEGKAKGIYRQISNFREEQFKNNISVANSYRVAEVAKKIYGVDCTVVYPPVVIEIAENPWEEKENAFICSGRLVKAKQPHKVIEILKQVREEGFDIKLYMTGGGGGATAWKYKRLVKQMAESNSDWVHLYENLEYKDYVKILAKCKYGLHYKQEPFGISIAEMVKAGAIPFVKSKGGQVEIVGEQNKELFFQNAEEAVEKIVNVLRDSQKQQKLLKAMNEQKRLYSTQRFMSDIGKVVESYFENEQGEVR